MGTRNDEDLAGLSDEERAALADDDDESEILTNIAGADDEDLITEEDHTQQLKMKPIQGDNTIVGKEEYLDNIPIASSDETNITENADDTDQDNAADKTPAVVEEFQPEFKVDAPEGIAEKLTALDGRTAELMEKFKNGDIELPEFMAQKSEIDNERLDLTVAARQADWAKQQNADTREQRWAWEQERFFGQDKSSIYKDDPIAMAALNASVKQLAADAANNRRAPGWFLEEADRRVRERLNLGGAKAADVQKNKDRAPDLSRVPKTLANLPAADISETGADEFAYLDKLDGIELEQALRKLTPEQEARYLGVSA